MDYIETERLVLKKITQEEAPILLDYLKRNKSFLEPWEPIREKSYYTIESAHKMIQSSIETNESLTGLSLYIFNKGENRIIGNISASNIVYGVFLSCHLGYKLDEKETNNGKMSEALKAFTNVIFNEYKLHRIEANIMPRNIPSIKAITNAGFNFEGISEKYLKINGTWEDHGHYVLLNRALE